MDGKIERLLSALHSRHINGVHAEDSAEAMNHLIALIPRDAVVGIGDSTTMRQLGLPGALKEWGITVSNPFELHPAQEPLKGTKPNLPEHIERLRKASLCDVFLTGTNAATEDGKLVSLDAVGNRVAGMFWGHPISIIVVGRNKIVSDLEEAFRRIRKVIAPTHVRIRSEILGGNVFKSPCAVTGECSDCRTKDRICNVFGIIEGKPFFTDLHVVIVNRDLGLGWDPSWPRDRITEILESYRKFVWLPPR